MDDAAGVRVRQRLADAIEHLEEPRQVVGRLLARQQPGVERVPVHQGHREERPRVGQLAQFVHGYDVGVLEYPGDPRLLDEPLAVAELAEVRFEQHLDSHIAPQIRVVRGQDGAHAAARQFARHAVATHERRERPERGRLGGPVAHRGQGWVGREDGRKQQGRPLRVGAVVERKRGREGRRVGHGWLP